MNVRSIAIDLLFARGLLRCSKQHMMIRCTCFCCTVHQVHHGDTLIWIHIHHHYRYFKLRQWWYHLCIPVLEIEALRYHRYCEADQVITSIIRSVPILYKVSLCNSTLNVGLITCKSKGFNRSIMVIAELLDYT